MKKIGAVFFDLDGTIVDTEELAGKVLEAYFLENNHRISQSDSVFLTGRTWEFVIDALLKKYPINRPKKAVESELFENYRKAYSEKLIVIPGAIESIRWLSSRIPLAVVSGSSRIDIQVILERLAVLDHFKFFVGSEDTKKGKPSPDPYLHAARLMKVEPSKILVFEDSYPGITAGVSAGMNVCAIAHANRTGQDSSGAHWKIRDFHEATPVWFSDKFDLPNAES